MKNRFRVAAGLPRASLIVAATIFLIGLLSVTQRASSQENCGPGYATDHILVKMREGVPAESLERMKALNGEGGEEEFFSNAWSVDLPAGTTVSEAMALYEVSPDVEYAALDQVASPDEACTGEGASLEMGLADGPDPLAVGEELTYAIVVLNRGPDPAVNAGATAVLPEGVRLVSSSFVNGAEKGECPPGEDRIIRCHFGDLGVGGSATLRVVVRPTRPGYLVMTAEPAADNSAAAVVEDSTTTAVEVPEYCTIADTSGDNVLVGTPGRDVICGFDGADRIRAQDGNDVVYGGMGDDLLVGGMGKDDLFGNRGGDTLRARDGVRGNDLASGGRGRDTIDADRNDFIRN